MVLTSLPIGPHMNTLNSNQASRIILVGLLVLTLSSCSSPRTDSDSHTPRPSPSTTYPTPTGQAAPPSANPDETDSTIDPNAYVFPDTTTWDGLSGYWFATAEHDTRCLIILDGEGVTQPLVSCDVTREFATTDTDAAAARCEEKAGSFQGWNAQLTEDSVHMGNCQSDVPIGVMCTQIPHPTEDPMCGQDWYAAPVLPSQALLEAGPFKCRVDGKVVTCTSATGPRLQVEAGKPTDS